MACCVGICEVVGKRQEFRGCIIIIDYLVCILSCNHHSVSKLEITQNIRDLARIT